jgi:hypothetical protein
MCTGAAVAIGAQARHVQRLRDDALAAEGRVAVDQDREHALAVLVALLVLEGARHAAHDRVHGLEVARVGREQHLDRAAGARAVDALLAQVVLDVARALARQRQQHALELAEDRVPALAQDVGQHVEPAAVRHADHDLLDALLGRALDELRKNRDQRVRALEREALVAHVLRVQEALEVLGAVQALEQLEARLVREPVLALGVLDALAHPPLAVAVGDVHVLDRPAPAVGAAQRGEDRAQIELVLAEQTSARERAVEVPDREAVRLGVERLEQVGPVLERIEVGDAATAHAVGVDELPDLGLLLGRIALELGVVRADRPRLPGHAHRGEDLLVEPRGARQELLDALQEEPGLGALDHAVVVGRGERQTGPTAASASAAGDASARCGGTPMAPVATISPWPFIRRGTLISVPNPPGFVSVTFVPW